MTSRLLLSLLLAPCALLHAQVVGPGGPYIREIKPGAGVTVTTNGYSRVVSAPGGAGDITGGAVTGGMLTVSESLGILTYGLTTNAVRSAVSGIYLPLAGGGEITGANAQINMSGTNSVIIVGNIDVGTGGTIAGGDIWHEGNDGAASNLDAGLLAGQRAAFYRDAANLTNTLDRARLPTSQTTPHISWASSDCTFHSTQGIWWSPYENTAIDFGAFGLRAAAADDQTGTLRTKWVRRPPEAAAYHETASIVLTFAVSATTGVTECRGLRLMGRDLKTDTPTTVYTDSTTRDGHASSAGALVTFVIARSSLSTTTLYNDYQAEVDISAEDGETWALESVEVRFQ